MRGGFSRRAFLLAATALGALSHAGVAPLVLGGAPRLSFHRDRPYLDKSGLDVPYVPPAGARGGAGAARLSDEALLRRGIVL